MVLGRATISDLGEGREAARAFNLTSTVLEIAPVVAPLIGAFLAPLLGWRGLLLIVVVVSAVTLIAIVPETHTGHRAGPSRRPVAEGAGLRSAVYLGNTAAFVFSFAAMMSDISASPFV